MAVFVAFLRGINLGASNRIAMPELRALAEALGYTRVATCLNSGNLVLRSGKRASTIESELRAGLHDRFGLTLDVVVRSGKQVHDVVAANPFPDGDPSQVTVAFLAQAPGPDAAARISAVATAEEPFVLAGTEVYVNYTAGQARSKLATRFADVVGVSATVRNLRTLEQVAKLADRT